MRRSEMPSAQERTMRRTDIIGARCVHSVERAESVVCRSCPRKRIHYRAVETVFERAGEKRRVDLLTLGQPEGYVRYPEVCLESALTEKAQRVKRHERTAAVRRNRQTKRIDKNVLLFMPYSAARARFARQSPSALRRFREFPICPS